MGCAQLGQCGGADLGLLAVSLRMSRTPHLESPRGRDKGAPNLVAKSTKLS